MSRLKRVAEMQRSRRAHLAEELERRVMLASAVAAFAPQVTFGVGNQPRAVVTADVNSDGRLDLVVSNGAAGTAGVLLGNGSGGFGTQATFGVGATPFGVAVADVNRDGRLDLITANNGSGNVSVLLGNGNGTFGAQQQFGAGTQARAVAVGDFNGDGKPDLAVANYGAAGGTVSVLLGNGNGSFAGQVAFAAGAQPSSIALGDFNRDGKLDLAIANKSSGTVSVLLGNGSGGFSGPTAFGAGALPFSVASGDVNGDGKLDLVVAEETNGVVGVLLGNGNGTFGSQSTFGAGALACAVVVGDVNGDGKLDVAVANYSSNSVSVLLGNGNGKFAGQKTFGTGTSPFSIASGDLNRDGRVDLVVGNFGGASVGVLAGDVPPYVVSIVRNGAGATVTGGTVGFTVTFSQPVTGVDGSDFKLVTTGLAGASGPIGVSGSGAVYTVTVQGVYGQGTVSIAIVDNGTIIDAGGNSTQDRNPQFAAGQTFAGPGGRMAAADLNGDGRSDVAIAPYSGSVGLGFGNGDGTFAAGSGPTAGPGASNVATADVNGDGIADLEVFNGTSPFSLPYSFNPVKWLGVTLGNGNGTFKGAQTFPASFTGVSMVLGDVNRDGKPDAVEGSWSGGGVAVLLGNGDGSFGTPHSFTTGGSQNFVRLADVNGDGKPDIVSVSGYTNLVSVLAGNGDGTFGAPLTQAVGGAPRDLAIGDLNGDGKPDVVVAETTGQDVRVLLGNGNGSFTAGTTFATGHDLRAVVLADVGGDGKLDVVTADGSDNTVSMFAGNGDGTLAGRATFAFAGGPTSLQAGDFSGDGRTDVVVGFSSNAGSGEGILIGSGAVGPVGEAYTVAPVAPQTFVANPIAYFETNDTGTNPVAVAEDGQGNLFGVARLGGAYGFGELFEVVHSTGQLLPVASFTQATGVRPRATLLMDGTGNLFGVTESGGANNLGTIFEVARGSSTITPLASFAGTNQVGSFVLDVNGNLFGVSSTGGTQSGGSVVELPAGGSQVVTLASFDTTTGTFPDTQGQLVVDGLGNIFGTTRAGGANSLGTVWELAAGSSSINVVAPFTSTTGKGAVGGLVSDGAGNLIGVSTGSISGGYAIFKVPKAGGAFTILKQEQAAAPLGPILMDGAGNIYFNNGAILELPQGSQTIKVLGAFNGSNGQSPVSLMLDGGGNLFGAAAGAGALGGGVVFKVPAGGGAMTTVANFDVTNGSEPLGGVTADGSGNLFGIVNQGGRAGGGAFGAVFGMAAGGSTVRTLAGFDGVTASNPYAPVTLDAAGNIYGTTFGGAIWELTPGATSVTILAQLDYSIGSDLETRLLRDTAGNLYGVTGGGGSMGQGTVFKLPAGGSSAVTLASFDVSTTGSMPTSGLVMNAAGDLFGATRNGGTGGFGVVFEIPHGTTSMQPVVSFDGTAGRNPIGQVVLDATGNLFGVTRSGGANGQGTVYEVPAGTSNLITLWSFNGQFPLSGLVIDANGNLFGSMSSAAGNASSIYEILKSTSTAWTVAAMPAGVRADTIAIDPSGRIYGTFTGGIGEGVYELSLLSQAGSVTGTAGADQIVLQQDADRHNVRVTVNGGTPVVIPIDDAAGLTLNGAGGNDVITLDYSNGNPLPKLVSIKQPQGGAPSVNDVTINGLTGANAFANTTLDINTSKVFLNYGSAANDSAVFALVKQYLTNGYNGNTWTGVAPAGSGSIRSSAAAVNPNLFAVGYADSSAAASPNTTANTIEVMYTIKGDATLDGRVNLTDLNALGANVNASPASWNQGNFNFDAFVNLTDLNILGSNVNQVLPAGGPAVVAASVASDPKIAAVAEAALAGATVPGGNSGLASGGIFSEDWDPVSGASIKARGKHHRK